MKYYKISDSATKKQIFKSLLIFRSLLSYLPFEKVIASHSYSYLFQSVIRLVHGVLQLFTNSYGYFCFAEESEMETEGNVN